MTDLNDLDEMNTAVTAARADLERAITDWPVTKALTAYLVADTRREMAVCDLTAARLAQGLVPVTYARPDFALEPLADYIANVAGYAAQCELGDA